MDVYGKTDGRDADGAFTRTPVLKDANVACTIQDSASHQEVYNGVLSMVTEHRIFTQYANVQNGDTIVFVDPADGRTVTARVTDSNARRQRGGIPTFFPIGAVEIRN
jgi:hypothetical protein